ncbi:MAG: Hsp33 family molecular chaperone HslO [Burkholderiales bacterium]|nr:Hsp33 family molecular chaperone HslO [Burkholderiales bacterium]
MTPSPQNDIATVDTLQKFLFENNPVRGELVDLSHAWQQVQERHDYPRVIQSMLGEMLAAASLLSANLKFDGTIIMQIHGDGPVKLLVAECNSEMQIRATAKIGEHAGPIADDASLRDLINVNGHGRFIITLDPKDKVPGQKPYQGIVPLDGAEISTIIENYMQRSEQLDTKLWLAADAHVARGLLLQRLPDIGGKAPEQTSEQEQGETWQRVVMLASTVTREEILSTDIATLMRRLFWEEDLRLFEPKPVHFHCSCTRDKVGNMLKMLGREEVESALADLGSLTIHCDFCGLGYGFDAVDCAQLFLEGNIVAAATDLKH